MQHPPTINEILDKTPVLKPLEELLIGLTPEDILTLSEHPSFNNICTDDKNRALMKILVHKIKQETTVVDIYRKDPYSPTPTIVDKKEQLASSRFKLFYENIDKNKVFSTFVGTALSTPAIKIDIVDFSKNKLQDVDLEYLLQYVTHFTVSKLILSNNCFSCKEQKYADLLWRIIDSVEDSVDIQHNDAATYYTRNTFFPYLFTDDTRAKKLIWIPKMYLNSMKWVSLINDPTQEKLELVKDTHNYFYGISK